MSTANYRKRNPEKAKTSNRLANFRWSARKIGLTDDGDIQRHVQECEIMWQEKKAQEASDVSLNPNTPDE
jgi:hypothetical protein